MGKLAKRPVLLPAAVAQLNQLETALGGRGQIVAALATAPMTKDVRYTLGLLADPQHEKKSLAEICALGEILPGQLLEQIERGTKLQARIVASGIIARGTPAMVTDVMQKAAPYEDQCTGGCQGTGTIVPEPSAEEPNPNPIQCTTCRGTGRLVFDADPECRKLGLEIAGLLTKGGGISIVNQNQNIQQTAHLGGGAFDQLQEAMDQILYGRKRGGAEGAGLEGDPAEVGEVIDGDVGGGL